METDYFVLSFVEIQLPLDYLKEAFDLTKSDDNIVLEKKGCFQQMQSPVTGPDVKEHVKLSFVKLNTHLKITFDKLQFTVVDGVHQCKLNSLNNDEKTREEAELNKRLQKISKEFTSSQDSMEKSLLHEDVHQSKSDRVIPIQKRKRGWPKKSNQSNIDIPADVKSTNLERKVKDGRNDGADEFELRSTEKDTKTLSQNGKRYFLRGKKLNSQIMSIEKGFLENFERNDSNDGETVDEDSLMTSDESDDEVKSFKRKEKKMQHRNGFNKGSNENKHYIKQIKSKVEEILTRGNLHFMNKESKENLFTCKICDENLFYCNELHKHVLEEHENSENVHEYLQDIVKLDENSKLRERTCCFCGKTFIDAVSLQNHKATFHKDSRFMCPLCDHKSKHIASLKIHVRNMHVELGKKAFCHLCAASFRSHSSLRQHIDLHHYGNKHVSCDLCKKQFYNKSQLKRHMRAHGLGVSRKFECKICGKSFLFEYNLKRHRMVVHQPQSESYHCSYCGKGFSQKVPMISHVQLVHFNLYPYSCKECRNSFPKAALLKEHMLTVHHQADFEAPVAPRNSVYNKTDSDKFHCSYCNESFTHKIRLIEHMHSDHADAFPFKCETCVQGFIEKSFLVLHMIKAHGVLIQNDEDLPKPSDSAGEIMQIITTKNGFPNKVLQAVSGEEVFTDDKALQDTANKTVTMETSAAEPVEIAAAVSSQTSTSLLVEVAQGSNTYQYVIEAPGSLSQDGTEIAVQDIANLLIAAEKTVQEGQQDKFEMESSSVHEVNLVIDDTGQSHVAPTGNDSQTVEILLGQNENTSLQTVDNQEQPREVVIDQSEQNSAIFTVENQAQTLHIEHGDIIELNDSNSDGRNYYRIVNVQDIP